MYMGVRAAFFISVVPGVVNVFVLPLPCFHTSLGNAWNGVISSYK